MSNISINFPSPKVKDKDKDEAWHKQFVQAIASQALNDSYIQTNTSIDRNYRYYNGDTLDEEFQFLQQTEDGEALPAKWMSMNRIKNRIDIMIGEFTKKSYSIRVEAINEEAKAKKLQYKSELQVDMMMQPIAQAMEQETGMPFQPPYPVPQDEDELEQFTQNYKEISEYVMETALKYTAKKGNWDYERRAIARDVYITGRGIIKTDIYNGIPRSRRVDPRLFVFDPYATNDHLTDAAYFGEVEYMKISEAAEKYNLSEKEIMDAYKSSQKFMKGNSGNGDDSIFNALIEQSPVNFFDNKGTELRVLVLKAVWRDVKRLRYKESEDKHGNIHIKSLRPSERDKASITKSIEIWRQGTLVAGKFMKEWGELENRPTDLTNLSETLPPYTVVIPNYINYKGVSIVDQLRQLQDLKNIVWYNIQKEMAAAGGKAFVYDVSQLPEGWDVAEVIKYLKLARIAFINSRVNGTQSGFNQFGQIDQSMSDAVRQYLEINMNIDAEMDVISGVNEARQGVASPSQAVGVTQASIVQSSMSREGIDKAMQEMFSRVLNLQARLIKLTWDKPETYSPIIGDVGVNFIEQDIELDLNDYAVFAEEVPPAITDQQMFGSVIMAGLQSGGVSLLDALLVLQEKDPREAILLLSKMQRQREEQAMQAQQQEQQTRQMEAQAQMAAAEQANQTKLQMQQMANQGKLGAAQIAAETQKDTTAAKNRAAVGQKELDAIYKMSIARQQEETKRAQNKSEK